MIRLLNTTGLIAMLLFLHSCDIRKGEYPCPDIDIRLYAEVFQNPEMDDPLHETEDNFYSRVGHLHYMLYKDGVLVNQAKQSITGDAPSHLLALPGLQYGSYDLVVIGNCVKNILEGTPEDQSSLKLRYPGWANTEDFFYRVFHFVVDSDENASYDVGLYRAHGFMRASFVNLPDFVDKIRVRVGNVTLIRELKKRDFISRHDEDVSFGLNGNLSPVGNGYILGTFPTVKGERSPVYIDLFHKDIPDTPYYSERVSSELEIVRNHLLDIKMTFNDGNTAFEINLDTEWDGSLFPSNGGGVVIE